MFSHKVLGFFSAVFLAAMPLANAKVFKYATRGDASSMEPYKVYEAGTIAFLSNIYEPLVMRDDNLKFVPGLATEWKNTEPTKWVFELRRGVKFHGGEDFNADDVVFSINRAKHELSDFKSSIASIKSIKKLDDYTVEVETFEADPILPNEIYSVFIVSQSWCEKNGAVNPHNAATPGVHFTDMNANGTGPFILTSRQPDTKTTLKKNALWWNGAEKLVDEVEFRPIPTDSTRIAALLSGDVDLIGQVPLQDIDRVKKTGFPIYQKAGTRTIFMGFDVESPKILGADNPLLKPDVRRAIAHAIDLKGIHEKIMLKNSTIAGAMIAPNVNGYNKAKDAPVKYDIALAKDLLKKAGFENGFNLPMECPNDRYINDEKICAVVATMLAKIGINAQLKTKPKSVYFGDLMKHAPAMFMLGWSPTTGDAHDTYFSLISRGDYNYGHYKNADVDKLADDAHKELDMAKRNGMFDQLEDTAKRDVPWFPLHHESVIWASKPGLTIKQKADDYIYLPYVDMN